MIANPDWLKPKVKPYFHQISLDCIEKLVECMESIDIEDMDCDTRLKMQEILSDEIEDEEFLDFAIDNLEELSSFIINVNGNLNIRIHRDITTAGNLIILIKPTILIREEEEARAFAKEKREVEVRFPTYGR